MVFPIIPILALLSIIGGGVTFSWYQSLSDDEKDDANALANQYAGELFDKSVQELTNAEAKRVHALVKNRFSN